MACDCIDKLNALFEERGDNTAISMMHIYGEHIYSTVELATEKRDPKNRQKPKRMLPTFCPFCAERYEPEAAS